LGLFGSIAMNEEVYLSYSMNISYIN